MATARYWRAIGLQSYGGGELSLSEMQLWGGGARLDASVTITGTAPTSGALTALSDGSTATSVTWSAPVAAAGGFNLRWDFVTPVVVDGLKVGTGATQGVSLLSFSLEYSSDGASWESATGAPSGAVPFPAANTLVSLTPAAFRHWRLTIPRWFSNGVENGSSPVRIAELQLFEGATKYPASNLTGPSAPSPYVVSASSEYPGNSAYLAFDGSVSDPGRWMSAEVHAGAEWIQIDLGAAKSLTSIKLAPDSAISAAAGYWIADFKLQGSSTGAFTGEQVDALVVSNLSRASWADLTLRDFSLFGSGFVSMPLRVNNLASLSRARNFETGGNGYISGTVKVLGDPTNVPTRRRVRLLRDRDAMLVAETWSDETTGAYLFTEIDRSTTYTVLTDDYQHSYRAVVADRITPSLMP